MVHGTVHVAPEELWLQESSVFLWNVLVFQMWNQVGSGLHDKSACVLDVWVWRNTEQLTYGGDWLYVYTAY